MTTTLRSIQDDPADGFDQLSALLLKQGIQGRPGSTRRFDFGAPGLQLHVCLCQRKNGKNSKPLKRLTSRAAIEQELQQYAHTTLPPKEGQYLYEYRFINPAASGEAREKAVNVRCALTHAGGIELR